MDNLRQVIDDAFERRTNLTPANCPDEVCDAVDAVVAGLDDGSLRVAEPTDAGWVTHEWIKKAVLLSFRITANRMHDGGFIEVHIATAIETCEERDRKGLYAKARAGIIKEFTGISDPYEEPEHAELVIRTEDCSPDEAAQRILVKLEALGYIN